MDRGNVPGRLQKRARILHALRTSPGLSRVALAQDLGISPATVRLIADELSNAGLIVSSGMNLATGGRPSGRLKLNTARVLSLGLDLGEVDMRLGLFNLAGQMVAERRQPFERDGRKVRLAQITAAVRQLLRSATTAVAGVGIAVPGLLDLDAGRVRYSANLGWRDVPLRDHLVDAVGLPVFVDRNTNAAMFAEEWWGRVGLKDPALFVTLGSGIGVAIRMDGRFLRGVAGSAGELGHVVIDRAGPKCGCGQRGCLEAFASSGAVLRRYRALAGSRSTLEGIEALALAARAGDIAATQALAEAAGHLAEGLTTVINLLNPASVVLGGELMEADRELLPAIRRAVRRHALGDSARQARIESATLAQTAPLIGAATLVFDALFSQRLTVSEAAS